MKKTFAYLIILSAICFVAGCKKDLSLEGGGLKASGVWSFSNQPTFYDGNIDTSYIVINGSTKVLHLQGPSLIGGQKFNLSLYSTNNFQPGSYKVSASEADFSLSTVSKTLFQSDLLAGEFIVNINSIGSDKISGDFAGAVDDSVGKTAQIVSGQFSSTIDLQNNTSNNTSLGTLGNSAGQCMPSTVAGTYTQNVTLSTNNTVQVQVNVTTLGTYAITTNTVNGVSFSANGSFTTLGVQNVTLNGTGTPSSSGLKTYTVTYGSSTCTFDVTFN